MALSLTSCQEMPFYDKNTIIPEQRWDHKFTPDFPIDVKEKGIYNIYINLRHTSYYPFSNFNFMLFEKGISTPESSHKYELKLAEPDGRWIGTSAGNLYDHSVLIKENYLFPDTGKYIFKIKQNMNEDPLKGINDIGIRIIKQ